MLPRMLKLDGNQWYNVHTELAPDGVESGDQLYVTVRSPTENLYFGNVEPIKFSPYIKRDVDESVVTEEGLDLWVHGPATLQVEYAP